MKRICVICSITVLFLAYFGFLTKAYGEDTQTYEGGVYDYTIIDDDEEYTVYLSFFSTDLPSVSIYCLKSNAILQTHAVHGNNLTELTFGNSFNKIEEGSFALCPNLENIISNDLGYITNNGIMYKKTYDYNTSGWAYCLFTYPRGKKSETFKIPETVNSLNTIQISSEAFYGCKNLKTIAIPNSITYIYNNAFYGCDNLEHVIVENDTPFSISSSAFPNKSSITLHVPEGAKTKYEAANFWSEFKDIVEVKQHNEGTSFTAKTTEGITMTFTVLSNSDLTCSVGRTSLNDHSPAIDNSYYGPITIPKTVDGYTVTKIDQNAFQGCNINNISIPNTITSIGDYAFSGCDDLSSITIPTSVTSIGLYAFNGCTSLTAFHLPANVVEIGTYVLAGCNSLESVTVDEDNSKFDSRNNCNAIIETESNKLYAGCKNSMITNGITEIKDGAFYGISLNNTNLPETIVEIGKSAFAYSSFDNLRIPKSVTYLGYNAFYKATIDSLLIPYAESKIDYSTYKVSGDNYAPFLNTTIRSARIEREFEYVYNGSTPIAPFRKANIENLYVGSKTISWLFEFSTITNLFFEDGITTIPSYALNNRQFANQARSTVKNIHLPEGIETISNYAFAYLGTETINIPSTVKNIGSYAFNSCYLTGKIIFPEGIVSIGEKAFYEGNVTLTQITCLANSPIAISENVFNSTTYTKTLNVPSGSQSLYAEATGWKNFSNIVEMETLSPALTFTDPNVKAICVQSWDANGDGELSEAEAAAVTDLGAVFMQNETITSFDELQYFTGLTSIGYYEFRYCSGLTSVTIPINVTSIGNCAFQYCTGLTSVTVEMETPLTIGSNSFSNRANATLYVPTGCKAAYEAADYWKEFKEIIEMAPPSPAITFANANVKAICVQNWDTDGDGELSEAEAAAVTDLGKVFMANKNFTSFDELHYFTSLTSIADSAFYNCTGMTSVAIPNTVTTIGKRAFKSCSGLTSVTIPESVTSIGYASFHNCDNLTSLTIPNSVTSVGAAAFATCNKLTSIIVENGNSSFTSEDGVLFNKDKTSLLCFPAGKTQSTYTIPESVTKISSYAFDSCSRLTSVDIPNSVISIGEWVFSACNSFTSVTIPNSVTFIGNHAFWRCYSMTSVTIPNSVTTIGSGAFGYCSALTSVKVGMESPLTIDSETFTNRANTTLYLPKGCKSAYQAADYWKEFKAIKEFPDSDVNQDGEIDMMDVVDIARFVVGTPAETFVEFLADLNNNGEVNVADAVVLVNEIVGDQNFAKAFGAPRQDQGDDRLTLTKNDDHSLSFSMESQRDYTAFQFDLYTNSEDDVMGLRLNTARKHGHQLIYNKVDEGHYRVVALSVANNTFNGSNGELLNIQLDGFNATDMTISSIHFITTDGTDYRFDDLSLSNATGIESLTPNLSPKEEGNVYDLSGRKVSEPSVLPKGVYIMNGKKVIVK